MKKILIAVLVLGLIGLQSLMAMAATTSLSQTMSSGTKSVASDPSAAFTGLTVSFVDQTATTAFAIDPKNAIGDGAKWDVTMTATHMTTIGPVKTVAGANSITTGGTYDGTYLVTEPVKRYDVKIIAGGAVGTATYQWRVDDGAWSATATTSATVTLEKGVNVNFDAAATYVAGDQWQFGVDVFPYTGLTVTPGTITADSGVTTGMTAGASGALTGTGATSDPKTLISTEYYRGMGDYAQIEDLSLIAHKNSIAGTYSGTATITIL